MRSAKNSDRLPAVSSNRFQPQLALGDPVEVQLVRAFRTMTDAGSSNGHTLHRRRHRMANRDPIVRPTARPPLDRLRRAQSQPRMHTPVLRNAFHPFHGRPERPLVLSDRHHAKQRITGGQFDHPPNALGCSTRISSSVRPSRRTRQTTFTASGPSGSSRSRSPDPGRCQWSRLAHESGRDSAASWRCGIDVRA